MNIRLYNSFENIPEDILRESVSVVIDVLRACTTICTALLNGCNRIYPVETVDDALKLYERLDKADTLLCGERKGKKIEGFKMGNSPFEYKPVKISGKNLILTTTNGTYSLIKAENSKEVLICGFVNMDYVTKYLNKKKEILIIISGKERQFGLEDAVCGGMLISSLLINSIFQLNDGASAALKLYESVKENLTGCLNLCEHSVYLKNIGFEKDVNYCFELNTHNVLPVFKNGVIVVHGK